MPSESELATRQAMPLAMKVFETKMRVREWHDHYGGKVLDYIGVPYGADKYRKRVVCNHHTTTEVIHRVTPAHP